ncbi:hypothetical protein ACS0TY_030915 [Phlomoides rotata]
MIMSTRFHLMMILIISSTTTTLLLSTTPPAVSSHLFPHHPSTENHDHEQGFRPGSHRNRAPLSDNFDLEKRRVPTGSNPLHNRR